MHLYHWKSTKLAPFFAIGCVNMHLICWTKFTHFSQFIFWNACFLFEFVAQSAFILLKHFFPSWLFAIGFINTQLFRWKSSSFALFLLQVIEKLNIFSMLFIYIFKCMICYVNMKLFCLKLAKLALLCDLFSQFFADDCFNDFEK